MVKDKNDDILKESKNIKKKSASNKKNKVKSERLRYKNADDIYRQ
ncbi:hypothetical protein [Virgibacillus sp. MSJ-26]|nr:hypothetical protein [Virgibacillus sp. MSJ-26]